MTSLDLDLPLRGMHLVARKHLCELGAPEPPMPPFDESKYEQMPEVEINPKDEFYVKDEG